MANLNIRNLSDEDKLKIRIRASQADKSMEGYVRDLALQSYYELRVQRDGDREWVAFRGPTTEAEVYALYDQWRQDENVTKLWLKCDGEFELVWPCAGHELVEGRCRRCRKILNVAPDNGASERAKSWPE